MANWPYMAIGMPFVLETDDCVKNDNDSMSMRVSLRKLATSGVIHQWRQTQNFCRISVSNLMKRESIVSDNPVTLAKVFAV